MAQAPTYFHDHWLMPEVRQLPEYLSSGAVLALGAGYNALWLASQGFNVTVAAEPQTMAEQAEQLGLSISFIPQRIDQFSPPSQSMYHAVLVQQQLHLLSLAQTADLIFQLKQHTNLGGFHFIWAGGDREPRLADSTKESLVPWLEWYADWRIVQFTHHDDDTSSRHAASSQWLFGHHTTLIAKNEPPADRQRLLDQRSGRHGSQL